MNRAVSLTLWVGTVAGVVLCGAATIAHALGQPVAATLARLGVIALFATPPVRLAVVTIGFLKVGRRRLAAASATVLAALLIAALRAAL